jgi:hypothetical protein
MGKACVGPGGSEILRVEGKRGSPFRVAQQFIHGRPQDGGVPWFY